MPPKKILVIDDEVQLTEMLKIRLESHGFNVLTLNSSEKALQTIKKEKPNAILLDVMMPGKDGYQICDEIKSDDAVKNIPIIMFTAKPPEKKFIKNMHGFYGADDYLLKPFDPQDLLDKINSLLKI